MQDFIAVDQAVLYEIILAANFMQIRVTQPATENVLWICTRAVTCKTIVMTAHSWLATLQSPLDLCYTAV